MHWASATAARMWMVNLLAWGLSQAEIFGLFDLRLPTGRLDLPGEAA